MNTKLNKVDISAAVLANVNLHKPDWLRSALDDAINYTGTQIERDYLIMLLATGDFIEFGNQVMKLISDAALADAKEVINSSFDEDEEESSPSIPSIKPFFAEFLSDLISTQAAGIQKGL